jgi:hypothetical protein
VAYFKADLFDWQVIFSSGPAPQCAACGEDIAPGELCYLADRGYFDAESDEWAHVRCVDGVSQCANCGGRGYTFPGLPPADRVRALETGLIGAGRITCPACSGRGWVDPARG